VATLRALIGARGPQPPSRAIFHFSMSDAMTRVTMSHIELRHHSQYKLHPLGYRSLDTAPSSVWTVDCDMDWDLGGVVSLLSCFTVIRKIYFSPRSTDCSLVDHCYLIMSRGTNKFTTSPRA
jgi:hypothetical protein